jgi:hypothetical protein
VQRRGRGVAGQRSRGGARRKEKELTSGPGASAGDAEWRAGELGLGRRWGKRKVEEEVDCEKGNSQPHVGEKEGSGPQGKEAG